MLPVEMLKPLLDTSVAREKVILPSRSGRSVKHFLDMPIQLFQESRSFVSFKAEEYEAQKGEGKASKSRHFDGRSKMLHLVPTWKAC
eukprot:11711028-Karenia_brevis.AAC.1